MLPPIRVFRQIIRQSITAARNEGHDVDELVSELTGTPDSYDALLAIAHKAAAAPMRADWPYVEPDDLDAIWRECDPARPLGTLAPVDWSEAAARVETAFLASVCGCVLGKPLEVNPTLAELRAALEPLGQWPLGDYVTAEALDRLGRRHSSWDETIRPNIRYVAPDDDINYTILGMLNLEANGAGFTRDQLRGLWLKHQSLLFTWGPERAILARSGLKHWGDEYGERDLPVDYTEWTHVCNPRGELCGALIRADAYGYACPARPALAAELAWRDAGLTHRRTGVYGAMFIAAAIATAFIESDPLRVFETALMFVPRRSRFHQIVADSLAEVRNASDWLDGYARIHGKYKQYSHCLVYQECGTLINTLRFAQNIDDGICKQVSQGNDTDSFGATAGSLLGVFHGPGHLPSKWLLPFNDEIRTGLNFFYERSLSQLARRMGKLPTAIDLPG